MSQWNKIVAAVDTYVIETQYNAREIKKALQVNEGIIVGMSAVLDALNQLRVTYRADEPLIKRINKVINERKQSRVGRTAQNAFDSITK